MENEKVKKTAKRKVVRRRRKRRKLRKGVKLFLVLLVALIILLFNIPRIRTNSKLKSLGYSKEQIAAIKEQKLTDTVLENGYYSENLAGAIENKTVRTDYLSLYTALPAERTLEDRDYLLYNRLLDAGYEEDQIQNLFSQLKFNEITPLLVFDYQWNEKAYIDDVLKNRASNTEDSFKLDGEYRIPYKVTEPTDNAGSVTVLVNQSYYLPDTYKPDELQPISSQYAVADQQLVKTAHDALVDMCEAGIANSTQFFVTTSYRSYDTQETAYNTFLNTMSESQADAICNRPGYSEHQTGLSINVASTYETDVPFAESKVYKWLKENCANYGWIPRYPVEKVTVTGMGDEPDHFRYVGRDLALAVMDSHLTYDEFYCLYLKKWTDEKLKPAEDILTSTDYHNHVPSTPAKTPEPEASQEPPAETQPAGNSEENNAEEKPAEENSPEEGSTEENNG